MTRDPLEHEITLALASGATLKLLYFSDREQRWIFSYDYVGDKAPGAQPAIANDVRVTANYVDGELADQFVLSMHVIVPSRLGQHYFAGIDISPGAKTYLEFSYERQDNAYRLVEICKGARDRVNLANLKQALVRPIDFPFPVADRIPVDYGVLRVPFRRNHDVIGFFELPKRTLRS